MPFVPVPNVCQAEIRCTLDGEEVENVLHFFNGNVISLTTMGDLGAGLWAWWVANIKDLVGNRMQLREIYISDLTTATSGSFSYTEPVPQVGLASGDMLPNNVALSVTKRTGKRGRSYRGRIYHMGFVEGQVTANQVNIGPVTDIAAAYSQLVGLDTIAVDWQLVVISRYANKAPRPVGISTPVIGMVVSNTFVDTQRRRLP